MILSESQLEKAAKEHNLQRTFTAKCPNYECTRLESQFLYIGYMTGGKDNFLHLYNCVGDSGCKGTYALQTLREINHNNNLGLITQLSQ